MGVGSVTVINEITAMAPVEWSTSAKSALAATRTRTARKTEAMPIGVHFWMKLDRA